MVSISALKPSHLKRYRDVARLLIKYGRSDLVRQTGLDAALDTQAHGEHDGQAENAEELTRDLEALGPTFVKLGQMLSTRADVLPHEYLRALSRLQDHVEEVDIDDIHQTIELELGMPINHAFAQFDPKPIASASIGQVHHATLPNGRDVAVKVQRPGVREKIVEDMNALSEVAKLLDEHTKMGRRYEFTTIIDDLRRSLMRELDYKEEAHNLSVIRENLKDFERIVVPRPVAEYTTGRVLTMDFVSGRKVTSLSPIARCEVDGEGIVDDLFRAYLNQILVHGFFHADPHPGNVFLLNDDKVALLDLGMVCKVPQEMRHLLLRLLLAIAQGRGEESARIALEVGELKDDYDAGGFARGVSDLVMEAQNASLERLRLGEIVISVQRVAARHGVRIPRELRMIGKTILNLERVAQSLDPKFDPVDAIERHAGRIMARQMRHGFSAPELLHRAVELKDFLEKLPGRINHLLEVLSNNEMRIRVDAIDERQLMSGFQKVANRITVGLIIAAMIVGAALMMRIETSFTIFGYPGLAILLFTFAAIFGIWTVLSIVWNDIKHPHDPRL